MRRSRWNLKVKIAQSINGKHALLRWCCGEVQSKLRIIHGLFTIRRVMKLKDDVGAGADEFRAICQPWTRFVPGLITEQQFAPVKCVLAFTPGSTLLQRRHKDLAGRKALQK